MKLLALDARSLELAGQWLAEKDNYQWLDFGGGVQVITPASLRIMSQKPSHVLRVFTPDDDATPIGLVGLSNIAPAFRTATLWYVLGDKTYAGRGYTSRAVAGLLALAFTTLGLESLSAWAVEDNAPSIHVLRRNGFRPIGRQRQCHVIDGCPRDRLLFDLLASEHGSA